MVADDHDGRVELAPENSKGPSKKGKRRQKKAVRAVQRLFETCKQVFSEGGPAGIIPSLEDVERLRSLLGTYLAQCTCSIYFYKKNATLLIDNRFDRKVCARLLVPYE